jgi:hypothetical protein
VVDGQSVTVGDPIAKAAPASIRHGGPSRLNPIDEFEWRLRYAESSGAVGLCAASWLPESDQALLSRLLEVMDELGRSVGDEVCLVERVGG